jgi:hypothetical protein
MGVENVQLGPCKLYLGDGVQAAVAASGTTGAVATNNALTWTAKIAGLLGNNIVIVLQKPDLADQSLSVDVAGGTVIVNLATDATKAATSTASQVKAAVEAHAAASQLVSVAHTSTSTGAGIVVDEVKRLSGGLDESVTDLGLTKGGVTFQYSAEFRKTTVDQYGNTAVKVTLLGESAQLVAPLAESTVENLARAIPHGKLVGAGANKKLTIGRKAGHDMLQYAKKLVAHPTANADTDKSDDVTFYKALPEPKIEYAFTADNERIYNVTFTAYPDLTRPEGDQLCCIGDPSIV